MNGFKPGDHVHVEFDGLIRPDGAHNPQWCTVQVESSDSHVIVRRSACTVIVPPVKVGDTVTDDNIGQLSPGSVVAVPRCGPWWRGSDERWHCGHGTPLPDSYFTSMGYIVLRVGESS